MKNQSKKWLLWLATGLLTISACSTQPADPNVAETDSELNNDPDNGTRPIKDGETLDGFLRVDPTVGGTVGYTENGSIYKVEAPIDVANYPFDLEIMKSPNPRTDIEGLLNSVVMVNSQREVDGVDVPVADEDIKEPFDVSIEYPSLPSVFTIIVIVNNQISVVQPNSVATGDSNVTVVSFTVSKSVFEFALIEGAYTPPANVVRVDVFVAQLTAFTIAGELASMG